MFIKNFRCTPLKMQQTPPSVKTLLNMSMHFTSLPPYLHATSILSQGWVTLKEQVFIFVNIKRLIRNTGFVFNKSMQDNELKYKITFSKTFRKMSHVPATEFLTFVSTEYWHTLCSTAYSSLSFGISETALFWAWFMLQMVTAIQFHAIFENSSFFQVMTSKKDKNTAIRYLERGYLSRTFHEHPL